MMVETILESSQDFGMSNGSLPQWKRELLQRRLARARPPACPAPAAPPPPPPPPPPPHDEDEELRYGPGIVKRLKSRYLSLALRDAPRRRPSVLRRAASLEHLLDERPPAAPAPRAPRAPRPASLGVPLALAAQRRDCVKRARSVDALSRLESRDELAPPPSPPPPAPAPRPPRAARPPLRPQPLLREAERPPPDVVRSTLRKFESAPARRPAPPARLVPRDPSPCSSPPATPPPPAPTSAPPPPPPLPPPVLPSPAPPSWSPPQSPEPACLPSPPRSPAPKVPIVSQVAPTPTPPRPVPAPKVVRTARAAPLVRVPKEARSPTEEAAEEPPSADEGAGCEASASASAEARRVSRAALEGIARAGSSVRYAFPAARAASHLPPLAATNPVLAARGLRRVGVIRPLPPAEPARAISPESPPPAGKPALAPAPAPTERDSPPPAEEDGAPRVNGHSTPEPHALSRIGAAGIERAWSGSAARRPEPARASPCPAPAPAPAPAAPWARAGRTRAPPPPATSVVFNFSDRKEVPDYIENDGIILRASRRSRLKAAGAAAGDADEEPDGAPPSPCDVRFVNDNVLINGRSSMPLKPNKDRIAKLKLQFDDSLTRTFEYPSETSFSEEPPSPSPSPGQAPSPSPAPADTGAALADNTHIASAALSRYTPHKTCAAAFHLGVSRPHAAPAPPHAATPPPHPPAGDAPANGEGAGAGEGAGDGEGEGEQDARPCGADAAKSWSDARAHRTDLLF